MCNAEAPSVEETAKKWAGKAEFYGVAWNGNDQQFQGFISKHGLTFPNVSDPNGEVFAFYQVPGQPAVAIIDRSGKQDVSFGPMDPAAVDRALSTMTTG